MIVLMPINGTGERMKTGGYTKPKALLPLENITLVQKALHTFSQCQVTQTIIIARGELIPKLIKLVPTALFLVALKDTSGPLETILESPATHLLLQANEDLVVADCDAFLDPGEYAKAIETYGITSYGLVPTVVSQDPTVTYITLNQNGYVQEIAEKNRISDVSATGPYYWHDARRFLLDGEVALRHGETSIGRVYAHRPVVQIEHPIKAVPVETFYHLGNPDAYKAYTHDR